MDLTTETHKVKGLAESRAVGCCECLADRGRNTELDGATCFARMALKRVRKSKQRWVTSARLYICNFYISKDTKKAALPP